MAAAPGLAVSSWNPYGCGRWRGQAGLVRGTPVSDLGPYSSGVDLAWQTLSAALSGTTYQALQVAMGPYGGTSGPFSCLNKNSSGRTLASYEMQCRTLTAGDPTFTDADAIVELYNPTIVGAEVPMRSALADVTWSSSPRGTVTLSAVDAGAYIPFDSNTGALNTPATPWWPAGPLPSPNPTASGCALFGSNAGSPGFPIGFVLPNPADCPGRTFKFMCVGALPGFDADGSAQGLATNGWTFAIRILPPTISQAATQARKLQGSISGYGTMQWTNNPSGNSNVIGLCTPLVDYYDVDQMGQNCLSKDYGFNIPPQLPTNLTGILRTVGLCTIADYWILCRLGNYVRNTGNGAVFTPGSTMEISYVTPYFIHVKVDGVYFGAANVNTQISSAPIAVIRGL